MAKLEVLYQGPIPQYKTIAEVEDLEQAIKELKNSGYRSGVFVSDTGERTRIVCENSSILVSFNDIRP